MEEIVNLIKQKSELRGIPDSLVKRALDVYLLKNNLSMPKSEKAIKLIVKEVRSELRKYAGQYATKSNIKKRSEFLSLNKISELLKEHTSTRERIPDYPMIKKTIELMNPTSILDLGCGINPIALAKEGIFYHAYDINENDLHVVREFFKIKKIKGDIHQLDIREEINFPVVDLCIVFKVLDILGPTKYEVTRKILSIPAKFFIISFATRTLTGRPMNSPYRRWFERILSDFSLSYEIKRTNQELFYVIRKN